MGFNKRNVPPPKVVGEVQRFVAELQAVRRHDERVATYLVEQLTV